MSLKIGSDHRQASLSSIKLSQISRYLIGIYPHLANKFSLVSIGWVKALKVLGTCVHLRLLFRDKDWSFDVVKYEIISCFCLIMNTYLIF